MLQASSISHLVGAANSKLAVFLRAREDEEARLIGAVKARNLRDPDERPRKRTSRYSRPASFSKPSPLVERGRVSGLSPFHMAMTVISRRVADPSLGRYQRPETSDTPALDHAEYIERDGAAEAVDASKEAYLARPGAVEQVEPVFGLGDVERAALGVPELDAFGPSPQVADGLAIVSNISDDLWERQQFWTLVEEHERVSRAATLTACPWQAPTWWEQLHRQGILDRDFEAHLLGEEQRYKAHVAVSNRPFKPRPYKVPLDKAERLFGQLRSLHGWSKAKAPVRSRKRSGRTQFRFVAELPADIPPHARLAIVRDFCSRLETLETNAAGEAVGMMYTAVIHAPDAQNDRRNYHLHLIAYDRPCRYLREHGEWDFAIVETYLHKGQERTRHPFRQNKLTISQSPRVTGRDGTGQDYPKAMREMFAGCVNEVTERYKSERRFHPGTYADCGIERGVTEHLGRLFPAEQIGVATEAGDRNAAIICADREREIRVRNARRVAEVRAARSVLASHAQASSPALRNLRERHAEIASEAETFLALKLSHDLFRLRESNARSRAERVIAHCEEQLSGRASHTARARKEREHLIRRRDEAASYLRELDLVLVAERARLDIVTRSFADRDARLTRDLAALEKATEDARALPVEAFAERVAPVVQDAPAEMPELVREVASAPTAVAIADIVEGTNTTAASATEMTAAPAMPAPVEDTLPAVVASSAAPGKRVIPAPPPAAHPAGPPAPAKPAAHVERTFDRVPTIAGNPEVPAQSVAVVSAYPAPAAQTVDTNPPGAPRAPTRPATRTQETSPSGADDPLPAPAANEADSPAITRRLLPQGSVRGAGSPGGVHRQIDALIERLIDERLAVVEVRDGPAAVYLVPALEAELEMLRRPSEIARIQAALRERHRIQEMEISHLLKWIVSMDPNDRAALDLALAKAPRRIRTIHSHWFDDRRVRELTTALERSEAGTAVDQSPANIAEPQQPIAAQVHDDVAKASAPSGNVSASPDATSDEDDEIARLRLLEAFSRGPGREGR